jgi:tetratricopeptide (TPR) repeat protein
MRTDLDLEILRGRADFLALVARKKAAEDASTLLHRADSGSALEKLKSQQTARDAQAKLVALNPRSFRSRADLAASQHAVGQILGDLDRSDEALKSLKDALAVRIALVKESPASVRSQLDVGWTHLALGTIHWKLFQLGQADQEWKAGLHAMETALEGESESSSLRIELDKAWIDIADKLIQFGLWDETRGLLDRAFRRNPASLWERDGHNWYVHAMLRLLAGDEKGYRESCAEFTKSFKNNERKFNLYRAVWLGASDPGDARALIPSVNADLGRNPTDDWYHLHAAMIHLRAGYPSKAREIMKLKPAMWDHWANSPFRALVALEAGNVQESRDFIERYRQFQDDEILSRIENTNNPRAVLWMDVVLLRETIRREVEARLDGMPGRPLPMLELFCASALARMGLNERAEQAFAAASALRPGDSKFLAAHARVLSDLVNDTQNRGDWTRRLSLVDRAIASGSRDPAVFRARAVLNAQRGEWQKASLDIESLFKLSSPPSPPRFVAGT